MWWILILLVIVGALAYLASLPPATQIHRSIVINKPVSEVYHYVKNFDNWRAWSPWLIHDPTTKTETVNAEQVGGTHSWDSPKIGTGQMQHIAMIEGERLDILITFIKPFKSKADAAWSFKNAGQGEQAATELTWSMTCKMPLFMRPFLPMMARMIGHDFELGLALLRGQLDPGSEHPRLSFDGEVSVAPQLYLAESFAGSFADMRLAMKTGYPKLWTISQQDPSRSLQAPMIAVYHKVKPAQSWVSMDMGLPIRHALPDEPRLQVAGGKYFQVTMHGNYEFLGSVWNAAYGHVKMNKLKVDNSRPALEVYTINPMQASSSNDWETKICVPIQ